MGGVGRKITQSTLYTLVPPATLARTRNIVDLATKGKATLKDVQLGSECQDGPRVAEQENLGQ